MRQLILDTETTGLDPKQGHRIIELAVVEIVDRRPTGRQLHYRLNPERDIDIAATEVHGLTWDDLKQERRFADVAQEFVEFARGAEWIIHNAAFDVGFLDAEFDLVKLPRSSEVYAQVTDTLSLARDAFPGKRNSLDALCERFGVSNAQRTLHGALLDAQLLAEVYLAMTRGQESLTIDIAPPAPGVAFGTTTRVALIVMGVSGEEFAAHRAYLEALDRDSKGRCVWLRLESAVAA